MSAADRRARPVPAEPVVRLRVDLAPGRPPLTVDGVAVPLRRGADPHREGLAAAADLARRLGRPVRAELAGRWSTWPLVVHPDGAVDDARDEDGGPRAGRWRGSPGAGRGWDSVRTRGPGRRLPAVLGSLRSAVRRPAPVAVAGVREHPPRHPVGLVAAASALAAALVVGAVGTGVATLGAVSAAPGPCRPITLVAQGGSAAGAADTLAAVTDPLTTQYGDKLAVISVPPPTAGTSYAAAQQQAVSALASTVSEQVAGCPTGSLMLFGYSEGAHVVGDLASRIGTGQEEGVAAERVLAVGLFGDPARSPFTRVVPEGSTGQGVLPPRAAGFGKLDARTIEICAPGDPVCDSPPQAAFPSLEQALQAPPHASYTQLPVAPNLTATQWAVQSLGKVVAATPATGTAPTSSEAAPTGAADTGTTGSPAAGTGAAGTEAGGTEAGGTRPTGEYDDTASGGTATGGTATGGTATGGTATGGTGTGPPAGTTTTSPDGTGATAGGTDPGSSTDTDDGDDGDDGGTGGEYGGAGTTTATPGGTGTGANGTGTDTGGTATGAPGTASTTGQATPTGQAAPTGQASSPEQTGNDGGGGGQICEKFGSTDIANGQYMVQNNEWGAEDGQCVTATTSGFTVDKGDHDTNDAPAAYPSIMSGCWMGTCTRGTTLPAQIGALGPISSSISATVPAETKTNLAYDIWADPEPKKNGHNAGMELMIWLRENGGVKPIGAKSGTANLGGATWDVWKGENGGVNVISYVRQGYVDAAELPITDFVKNAVEQGSAQADWYLTNIQAGFEPWQGGPGLALDSFSVDYGGQGSTPSPTDASPTGGGTSAPEAAPSTSRSPEPTGSPSAGPPGSSTGQPTRRTGASPGNSGPSSSPPSSGSGSGSGSAESTASPGGATDALWSLTDGLEGFQPPNGGNVEGGGETPVAAPSPNVPGRTAVRVEVPAGGKRSEVRPEEAQEIKPGEHMFFGYSAFLPEDFPVDANSWQVVWQLHDGGTNTSPPVALEITGGKLWLANVGERVQDLGPVQPGRNLDVQLDIAFEIGGGSVTVHRAGRPVLQDFTPPKGTMIDDFNYLKTGVYRDPGNGGGGATLFLNDLKIGSTLESVSQLAGAS